MYIELFCRSERLKMMFRFDARIGSYFGRDPNHKTLAASLLGADETSWEKPEDMHNAIDQFIERQKAELIQREQVDIIENQEADDVSASSLVASNDSFFHHHEQKAMATIEEKEELELKTQFS
jgi:hypothetical protein